MRKVRQWRQRHKPVVFGSVSLRWKSSASLKAASPRRDDAPREIPLDADAETLAALVERVRQTERPRIHLLSPHSAPPHASTSSSSTSPTITSLDSATPAPSPPCAPGRASGA